MKTLIAGWNVAESDGVAVSIRLPANRRGVVQSICNVFVALMYYINVELENGKGGLK